MAELVVALADPDLDDPVQQAFGPALRFDASGFDAGLVPDMVDDDHTSWDVCATDFAAGVTLGRAGLLEEIDFSVVSRRAEGTVPWWGLPAWTSRLVLVRDANADDRPQDWAGFYDIARFPGLRAMPGDLVIGVLETALLADGVLPSALYPLDVERAFARLKVLRPQMAFWRNSTEARALMTGGAVAGLLCSHTAQALCLADDRFAWSWQQGVLIRTLWVVPKGGPAGAAASMRFIAATQAPERQAEMLLLSGCGPAGVGVRDLLDPGLSATDPGAPGNATAGIAADETWYVENASWLLARWHALVQG